VRVLVIGSGAREHALLSALRRDEAVRYLAIAPGNAGTAALAEQYDIDISSPEQVTALAESGLPEDEIPRVATERAADMVVMATRGLGAVGALLLGSVTQRVVHNATVPVLLVK
jgi:nucleotide-binding universal stress UspA family protein